MPPISFNSELKNKEWGDYQYEVDEARSTAEKKAAKNWADAILANGEKRVKKNEEEKQEKQKKNQKERTAREQKKEEEPIAREEKQKKEAEKKRIKKAATKAAHQEKMATSKREREEAMKKGDMKKLIELNLERKTELLKKIGYQTKKCRWEHEPGGCWSHKKGKCPYKHNCNTAKNGGTRKQRR